MLITRDYYLLGSKSDGPIRILGNMMEQFGDKFRLKLIASDRDKGDAELYPQTMVDYWQLVVKA